MIGDFQVMVSFGKRKAKEGSIDFFRCNCTAVDFHFKTFVKRNGGDHIAVFGERKLSGNVISLCMSLVRKEF